MFNVFKSKNKKRGDKRETLSVRSRAGKAQARGVKLAGTLLCFSLSLFLLVMMGWKGIEYLMQVGVYKNPSLAVDTIEVETDGVVSLDKIAEWARVKLGDNLLALDLTRIKRDLELRAIVESASVEKILPRTLRISITERKPLAVALLYNAPPHLDRLYLDAEGMVIPPLMKDERNPKADPNPSVLPVLTGFNARVLRPGKPVEYTQIRAALDLLAQYDRATVSSMTDFKTIDLSSAQTITVTTDERFQVTFAPEHFGKQLARLQSIIELGRKEHRTLASVDLAVGNYVPARWVEPSTNSPAVPTVHPINLKPRKKHV